jgi:hypothetical protein
MKRLILVVAVLVLSQARLFAADPAKGEIFGGYSFLNVEDLDGEGSRDTLHGWMAAYEHNVQKNLGIVADFGGHYKTVLGLKVNTFEYTFGPRYNYRIDKAAFFAHALYGGLRLSGSAVSPSENDFMMLYGGGFDVKASETVDIRVVQVDWAITHGSGGWEHDAVRFGFGAVFKVGR